MINDKEIKQFVRETLGCTCPEEVLQHIECQANVKVSDDVLLDYEINVGSKDPRPQDVALGSPPEEGLDGSIGASFTLFQIQFTLTRFQKFLLADIPPYRLFI